MSSINLYMDTLVKSDWLSQHLHEPDLVVLDCTVHTVLDEQGKFVRNESGRSGYDQGHIPTAGFADLTGALCDTDSPIEFAVPTPEQFCSAMSGLGVGDSSRVVLYDSFLSAWAARVWWMLRWVGFDRAAILDGGIGSWLAAGLPLSHEPAIHTAVRLTPKPRPRLIADRDEVFAAIGDDSVRLIDTLPATMYTGEEASMYGRPGHIPGAINLCAMDLLDESGCYLPEEQIAAMHEGDRDARIISYCGGGIMASSSAFIMTRLGFTDVAVYTASLQEWAADASNPMVVGES